MVRYCNIKEILDKFYCGFSFRLTQYILHMIRVVHMIIVVCLYMLLGPDPYPLSRQVCVVTSEPMSYFIRLIVVQLGNTATHVARAFPIIQPPVNME